MKTHMPPVLITLLVCTAVALGQNMPGPAGGSARAMSKPTVRGASANLGPPLKQNVTLTFKGTFQMDLPVDFSVTGAGPQLTKDSTVASSTVTGATMRFKGAISEAGDGYFLEYTLAMEVPMKSQDRVSHWNFAATSSVRLKPGQPVQLLDNDGKPLTVTLTISDAS